MLQKLIVRNVVDEKLNPAGGSVRGVGIKIDWQDGPLRDPDATPAEGLPAARGGCEESEKDEVQRHFRIRNGMPAPEAPFHNGAFIEGVITAAIDRLEFQQASRFKCQENADAIDLLKKAVGRLMDRTNRRIALGIEGTHEGA
jgi:hypothetical protein